MIMELKPTLTFHEQLDLLKSRSLLIRDDQKVLEYLKLNSYYHLNIYFKYFQRITGLVDKFGHEESEFVPGCTFETIVKVHEDDKNLRRLYLEALQPIELYLRTIIAYFVGSEKGSNCFYLNDPKLYADLNRIRRLRERFEDIVCSSARNPIVQHHAVKYDGKYPLFVIFELTSFNFLVEYFQCLSFGFQNKIVSQFFRLNNATDFKIWLQCLNDLRNICAHQNYLFTRLFNSDPAIQDSSVLYGSNRKTLFAYTIVLGYLSQSADWVRLTKKLKQLDDDRHLLTKKSYGFDADWHERLISVRTIIRST